MGAQHVQGHGRGLESKARKRPWPRFIVSFIAIMLILVLSQLVPTDGDAKLQQQPKLKILFPLQRKLLNSSSSTNILISFPSLLQFFSPLRTLHLLFPHLFPSSTPPNPTASEAVCYIPSPFATAPPTSPPVAMALADESNRIVEQFEFPDEDLNRHVKEFLRQMGMLLYRSTQSVPPCYCISTL
ncbi:uncharacterized protein B0J16DRAFT_132835 [Fusarium flagelliforme]|uniref:uncharacterized protein n=1 Tax=Fusarium flagelliforme TaxID=2675880 RepID=UPI001E8DCEE1|nr:uncharacterized protein B0J16DRAFT_132835 [Fusarium flagelliforme]KAH7185466.1 hypothetical protein B0J16DRAFT_132835 [Fusarium flagelliforme]